MYAAISFIFCIKQQQQQQQQNNNFVSFYVLVISYLFHPRKANQIKFNDTEYLYALFLFDLTAFYLRIISSFVLMMKLLFF